MFFLHSQSSVLLLISAGGRNLKIKPSETGMLRRNNENKQTVEDELVELH